MQAPGSGKPFFGRDDERARIATALRLPGVRLVTLIGLGGIGKTALADCVAAEAAPGFPDGVCHVLLAAVTDPALVANAIRSALQLPDSGPRPPVDTLIEHLAGKRALIVLDNIEHLQPAGALIAQLIAATTPGPSFLVTSRAPLGLPGEFRVEIGPLPLPAAADPDVDVLRGNDAARLFEWRVRMFDITFAIDAVNAADIAEICRALDGIPLALELAAARVRLLGIRGLLDQLRQPRLGLLRSHTAEFPERQRAMSVVIAWSYELLGVRQEFFRRLCVFAGGFTLDAAEAAGFVEDRSEIASPTSLLDRRMLVIDYLDELIRLGLVRSETTEDGGLRYLILKTIREYGLDQMSPAESADAHWALARYLLSITNRDGVEEVLWAARVKVELDNVRGALTWLLAQGSATSESLIRLGNQTWVYWKISGQSAEGRRWLLRIRETADGENSAQLAESLVALGNLESTDFELAISFYNEARQIYNTLGDRSGEARAWSGLGITAEQRGAYRDADNAHRQSLELWTACDDRDGIAHASYQIGYTAIRAGDDVAGKNFLEAARAEWEKIGKLLTVSYSTMELGRRYRLVGEYEEARQLLWLSRDRFEHAAVHPGVLGVELALLDWSEGQFVVALDALKRLLCERDALDLSQTYILEALEAIASIAQSSGDHRLALTLVEFILHHRTAQRIGAPRASSNLIERVRRHAESALPRTVVSGLRLQARLITLNEAIERALALQLSPGAFEPAPVGVPVLFDASNIKLTPREKEVLALIGRGLTDKEIAHELGNSYRTVTTHVGNLLSKADVTSRTLLVNLAYRLGLVSESNGE